MFGDEQQISLRRVQLRRVHHIGVHNKVESHQKASYYSHSRITLASLEIRCRLNSIRTVFVKSVTIAEATILSSLFTPLP